MQVFSSGSSRSRRRSTVILEHLIIQEYKNIKLNTKNMQIPWKEQLPLRGEMSTKNIIFHAEVKEIGPRKKIVVGRNTYI